MCIGYDPLKWSDNFESYEEMYEVEEKCLQQKNDDNISEEVTLPQ